MPMAAGDASAAVQDGIRRALDRESLPQDEYDAKIIKVLREDLKDSLSFEVPTEDGRLDLLGIAIRRRCRKIGWVVETPANSWYTKDTNQGKLVSAIADFIMSKPMQVA